MSGIIPASLAKSLAARRRSEIIKGSRCSANSPGPKRSGVFVLGQPPGYARLRTIAVRQVFAREQIANTVHSPGAFVSAGQNLAALAIFPLSSLLRVSTACTAATLAILRENHTLASWAPPENTPSAERKLPAIRGCILLFRCEDFLS